MWDYDGWEVEGRGFIVPSEEWWRLMRWWMDGDVDGDVEITIVWPKDGMIGILSDSIKYTAILISIM